MMVKVIGTNATPEEVQRDIPEVQRKHEQAMQRDPLWEVFGGTVYVNGIAYQVVEEE